MLYCPVCQTLLKEKETSCPNCKNKKYREVQPNDPVPLIQADEMDTDRIAAVLDENGIPHEERMDRQSPVASVYIGRSAYVWKHIFVPYAALDRSRELLRGIGMETEDSVPETPEQPEKESPEEMSRGKRLAVRIITAVLFFLLVWAVVAASDTLFGHLRDIFIH